MTKTIDPVFSSEVLRAPELACDSLDIDTIAQSLHGLKGEVDKNPQTAARMCSAFETITRYDPDRQALARAALNRIADMQGLSRNTSEMVTRILAGLG